MLVSSGLPTIGLPAASGIKAKALAGLDRLSAVRHVVPQSPVGESGACGNDAAPALDSIPGDLTPWPALLRTTSAPASGRTPAWGQAPRPSCRGRACGSGKSPGHS